MATLSIIAAGICWGIIGLFSRTLAGFGLSPLQLALGRSLVTALILVAVAVIRDPRSLHIRKKDCWMFLGTGIGSLVFFNVCYFTAIQLTTLSVAAILLYTAPSIVMIFSVVLFKERFTSLKALCLLLSFSGCVLVSGLGAGSVSTAGILAGLGAGLGYALYSVFGHYALEKYRPLTVTSWTFIVASLALLPFSGITQIGRLAMENTAVIFFLLLLGLLSTALPYSLYTFGLRRMEAGRASVLASVEPLTSTLTGFAVFHEDLTLSGVLGIICILTAVVLLGKKAA